MKKSKKEKIPKLSAVDQDVLTALKVQGESYPLEILDCINLGREEHLGSEFTFSSLYPALGRLKNKKLVDTRWGDEDESNGGARRKYYKINATGLKALTAVENYRSGLLGLFKPKILPTGD